MTLSIIVPVYNVEKHLECCLESIAMQMSNDYELVLVDDGSTDMSRSMCDDFARAYPERNVKVIHQPNGGLSEARNRGIDEAKGKYITFVDSDDELCPHTLKENLDFLLAHPEVDMLEYPVEVHAGSPKSYMLTFPNETQRSDIFADWIRREGYAHCYAWNKIYAARLWQSVRFPRGLFFEDTVVMPEIVKQCRQIHYSSRGCYRYFMHAGSITTSYRYEKQRQLFESNHRLYLDIKDNSSLQNEALRLWIECLNQLIDLGRCADADKEDYHVRVKAMRQHRPSYRQLLKAAPTLKTRIKLLPLPIIGLPNYCTLYVKLAKPLRA